MEDKEIVPVTGAKKTDMSSSLQAEKPWLWPPGVSGNPAGRKPDTLEQKALKKATKIIVGEYIEKLAEALPGIEPVLIKQAKSGDIAAIKEVHDRVMGKAVQKNEFMGALIVVPDEKQREVNEALLKFLDQKNG